jgi:hypothetical protein
MVLGQRRGVLLGTGLEVHTEPLQERDVPLRRDPSCADGIEDVDLDSSDRGIGMADEHDGDVLGPRSFGEVGRVETAG